MTQDQTHLTAESIPSDCIFRTVLDFMLPFFLAGAGGDVDLARAAILELLDAYAPVTMRELDLASRVIVFGIASMDNLRLSMSDPSMSDTVKLRYRSNAVALSRSAEQCRVTLEGVQAKGRSASTEVAYSAVAQPYVAQSTATGLPASRAGQLGPCPLPEAEGARKTEPAVPTVVLVCSPAQAVGSTLPLTQPRVGDATDTGEISDFDIEQMKRDARVMIHALHARGGPISAMDDRSVSDPRATDPFAAAKSAADAALAAGGSQHTQNAGVG